MLVNKNGAMAFQCLRGMKSAIQFELEHPVTKQKLGVLISKNEFHASKEDDAIPVICGEEKKKFIKKFLIPIE